jgi:hypothetical protein
MRNSGPITLVKFYWRWGIFNSFSIGGFVTMRGEERGTSRLKGKLRIWYCCPPFILSAPPLSMLINYSLTLRKIHGAVVPRDSQMYFL